MIKIIMPLLVFLVFISLKLYSQEIPDLTLKFNQEFENKNFEEALKTALTILSKAEKNISSEPGVYKNAIYNLAEVNDAMGNFDDAINYYNELFNIRLKELEAINPTFSNSLTYTKDMFAAITDKKVAIGLYKKTIERISLADSADYSAIMDITAYYTKAINEMYGIQQENPQDLNSIKQKYGADSKEFLKMADSLALSLKNYGKYPEAIEIYLEIYGIMKDKGDTKSQNYAKTCMNIGYLYFINQKYDKSEPYYKEGIDVYKSEKYKPDEDYINAIFYHATYYMFKQDWKNVVIHLEEGTKVIEKHFTKEHIFYSIMLANIASAYKVLEDYENAEKAYQKYYNAMVLAGDTTLTQLLGYYMGIGPVYEKTNRMDKAEEAHIKSNQATMNIINDLAHYVSLTSEKRLSQSFIWFTYNLNTFYSFCLKRLPVNPALTSNIYNNELMKKGMILRLIKSKMLAIHNSGDTSLIASFREWIDIRQKLAKLYILPLSERKENVATLENRVVVLEQKMSSGLFLSGNFIDYKTSWKDIQKKLKADEAAVEFMYFDAYNFTNDGWADSTVYGALIIRPGYQYPKYIQLFIEDDFKSFLNRNMGKNSYDQSQRLYNKSDSYTKKFKGDSLYQMIWEPIEPHLADVKKVYFSPAGLLHKISLPALVSDKKGRLIDKYDLEQLSSTGAIAEEQKDFKINKDYKAVLYGGILYDSDPLSITESAKKYKEDNVDYFIRDRSFTRSEDSGYEITWDYLQGTLLEVNNIDSLFKKFAVSSDLLTESNAVEESFKYDSGNTPDIIHIATHGFFFPEEEVEKTERYLAATGADLAKFNLDDAMMRSGLLFAGANNTWQGNLPEVGNEDGVLTAYEVSKMDLSNTKLVVLSACETGLGEIKGSEGVYGLQRAFKMAGVEYIIMSLWQIPDQQTVELMNMFYGNWLSGMDIKTAFSNAQKEMSKKYEPFYWAAFVLVN